LRLRYLSRATYEESDCVVLGTNITDDFDKWSVNLHIFGSMHKPASASGTFNYKYLEDSRDTFKISFHISEENMGNVNKGQICTLLTYGSLNIISIEDCEVKFSFYQSYLDILADMLISNYIK